MSDNTLFGLLVLIIWIWACLSFADIHYPTLDPADYEGVHNLLDTL